ncbi:MAG TPA: DUF3048 domain-containing protein [Actinomycetota bacterium]|nr:DUF3048 domain-containing protein [Actinomycetota bacterium]
MALSTRGKTLVGILSVVVLAGAAFVGFRLLTKEEGEPIIPGVPILDHPTLCPLTGEEASSDAAAERPALAIKVENIDEARPQAGLLQADVIWEEEAEGGITRFIAVYQCQDARRVGPVRSARPVDPPILRQLGRPLFGYAGGVASVEQQIAAAGVIDLNYIDAADAYTRDPNRSAPHDLYTSTRALRRAAGGRGQASEGLFTYEEDAPERRGTRPGREIVADWSIATDVVWRYRGSDGLYRRFHGEEAHTLEDGSQVAVSNVVVMLVERLETRIVDPAGNPVPNFDVVGRGDAIVFRDGRAIRGRWERPDEEDLTRFVSRDGEDIPLKPGITWIMLYPTDAEAPIEF